MKKLYILRIFKFIALLLPITIFVLFTQAYMFCFVDINTDRIHDFYNEDTNSLDVVIMGASDVCTGFAPGYAYDKYGYTSYLYAIDSNPSFLYQYELQEILKTQQPQLILVEVEGFLYDEIDEIDEEARLRIFAENIPMSLNKLKTIFKHPTEDKLSNLIPFVKYHSDWQNTNDLRYRYSHKTVGYNDPALLKNIYTYTMVNDEVPQYNIQNDYTSKDFFSLSEEHLRDFLEFCQQEQIDYVVFIRFPHKIVNEDCYYKFLFSNRAGEIISQYNYPWIDLERRTAEIGIDYQTDFFDYDHLNVYGQQKLTCYISKLITEDYQIIPRAQTRHIGRSAQPIQTHILW